MSNASDFVGSIPEFYDSLLGPILFQDYAADLAARAAAFGPTSVLELACGTGISTRALRDALPAATRIVATDLNPPMLEIAQRKAAGVNVEFSPADALALPMADASFDLVACQFGVMFFPDKTAGFREARRVLKPHGALLFNVWGPLSANPFAQVMLDIGARFFPEDPPKFYRTPFGYADTARVRADLAAAGFGQIDHEIVRARRPLSDLAAFARGAVCGNPLIAELQAAKLNTDDFIRAVTDALRARFGAEPTTMPLEAHVFTARFG